MAAWTRHPGTWVAIASAPEGQAVGTVTMHPWDGAHGLGAPVASVDLEQPSWLTWARDGRHLHVACESQNGHVVTLAAELFPDGTPTLSPVGRAPTGGANPCHLALLPDGLTLLSANSGDGAVSALAVRDGTVSALADVERLTGSGPHPSRQRGSHAHQVVPLSSDRVAVVDLGADEIVTYAVRDGALHRLTSSAMPPGAGPRHLAHDRRTRRAWVGGELSGSLIALRQNGIGGFEVVSETPASASQSENAVAQIWLATDGQRLLISNRGPDTVSLFDVTSEVPVLLDGVDVPAHPRHFQVEGTTMLVAGRDADVVTTHSVDRGSVSTAIATLTIPTPMCIAPQPIGTRSGRSGLAAAAPPDRQATRSTGHAFDRPRGRQAGPRA